MTELRRISQSGDRKVRFGSFSEASPGAIKPGPEVSELAATLEKKEKDVDAPEGFGLPLRPATS